jgi:PAS domain S-box-containing protein
LPESTNLHEPAWLAQWPRYFIDTLEIYAVFAIDLSGVILSWQPGVKHVFGYERESFVGQPADIIFTEVDRQNDAPEREMGIALRNGWAKDERWHVCKNGARFWGSGIMIAVRDDSEQVVGFAKLVRDRTSERLEDEVKELTALRLEGNLVVQDKQIRTLAEDLTLAEQRERRRISQLLNDELQQQLYALQMMVSGLRREVALELAERTEEIHTLLKASVAMTRTLVSELDPLALQEGGFNASLDWLAEHVQERYGFTLTLHGLENCPKLPPALSILLLQCLQELLFNIVKHAGVKKATLVVAKTQTSCSFTLSDEGTGFVVRPEGPNEPRHEGFGLQSVRRRLEPFGGTLQVSSRPGDGTRVTISLP